ncbi:B12-binding domain-containing radical SAM protein [Chloroflexota bacterium]
MNKLTIYLGDPVHNFIPSTDIWTVPLNICNIASYVNSFYANQVEFHLFKFPDSLLDAISHSPPDIIGLSNYIWNSELSKKIIRFAKEKNSKTVTVMGGVNITREEGRMTQFMNDCCLDFYVSLYGEHPFKSLVSALLKPGSTKDTIYQDPDVHGVWYLDNHSREAVEIPVKYNIADLDDIPSPYNDGLVDQFFQQGLIPMIESNRGCPFSCIYCDWGSAGLRKITEYSVKRMKEDIEYCRQHSKDERLMIDDANFGILGKRDLEIAEYLQILNKKTGYPGKLILTWSEAKSAVVLKITDALKDMAMVTTSFQSMNEEVLKNINRNNITHEHFTEIISFCKERKIDVYGELMLALPGETLESHFKAIRYLFDMGADFININPLMLLEGSSLATTQERAKHTMKTKWRLLENCYGVYDKTPVIEYQEMVVQTDTLTEEEYLLCRPVSWLIQMSWNLGRHDLLMKYMHSLGVNPLDFILEVIKNHHKAHPKVAAILADFFQDARDELFNTKERLISYYSQPELLEMLRQGGFRKLNTHYTSRVSLECDKEFIDYYRDIAKEFIREKSLYLNKHEDKIDACSRFMYHQYINYSDLMRLAQKNINKKLSFQYDILEWVNKTDKPLQDFFCSRKVEYSFSIDSEQRRTLLEHLNRFKGLSTEYQLRKLQEPYHGIHRKYLLFNIEKT